MRDRFLNVQVSLNHIILIIALYVYVHKFSVQRLYQIVWFASCQVFLWQYAFEKYRKFSIWNWK